MVDQLYRSVSLLRFQTEEIDGTFPVTAHSAAESGRSYTSSRSAFRTVGGDDLCGNRRQRVHRLRVRPSTRPKIAQDQRGGRHHDHLAGRLHALHTAVTGCGRRAGRRTIRHDSAGEHPARRAGGARQGGHGRFQGAHRHVHRPRTAIPHHVVGSPGVDAGLRHPPFRRARSRHPRARVEVDRRGALSARPRARATRTGQHRRRPRPRRGPADDRRGRRVLLGDRARATAAGVGGCRGRTDGLRPGRCQVRAAGPGRTGDARSRGEAGRSRHARAAPARYRRPAWHHAEGGRTRSRCAER